MKNPEWRRKDIRIIMDVVYDVLVSVLIFGERERCNLELGVA